MPPATLPASAVVVGNEFSETSPSTHSKIVSYTNSPGVASFACCAARFCASTFLVTTDSASKLNGTPAITASNVFSSRRARSVSGVRPNRNAPETSSAIRTAHSTRLAVATLFKTFGSNAYARVATGAAAGNALFVVSAGCVGLPDSNATSSLLLSNAGLSPVSNSPMPESTDSVSVDDAEQGAGGMGDGDGDFADRSGDASAAADALFAV